MRCNNVNFNIKILKGELNKKSLVSKMSDLANKNSEWCDFAETSKNRFKNKPLRGGWRELKQSALPTPSDFCY